MKVQLLEKGDFRREPWKNGGGFTTELARHDEDGGWVWRVSVAEVERDGPFSDFAGHDRIIVLLEGKGMELSFEGHGTQRIDRVHQPFGFDGGWKASCRLLGGPVRDLNLIVDRARAHGSIAVLPAYGGSTFSLDADWALFLCLAGSARIEVAGSEYCPHAGELLRIDEGGGAAVALHEGHPGTAVADIRIVRKGE